MVRKRTYSAPKPLASACTSRSRSIRTCWKTCWRCWRKAVPRALVRAYSGVLRGLRVAEGRADASGRRERCELADESERGEGRFDRLERLPVDPVEPPGARAARKAADPLAPECHRGGERQPVFRIREHDAGRERHGIRPS